MYETNPTYELIKNKKRRRYYLKRQHKYLATSPFSGSSSIDSTRFRLPFYGRHKTANDLVSDQQHQISTRRSPFGRSDAETVSLKTGLNPSLL